MGFHYKKNIGQGYQMKQGNSPFRMVTPTVVDNSSLFYKFKEGIPNVLNVAGTVLGGFGAGQLLRTGIRKITEMGARKATPIIARKVGEKVGQKTSGAAVETITNVMNPFAN